MSPVEKAMQGLPELLPGHVWLAGAGPGDPGLLTLHGLHALGQADTVVFDALVDQRIVDFIRPGADRLFAGKRGGRPSAIQGDITATLIELARQGRRVLRLKGGDPFVFGRGGEEVLALAEHGIPFRVIPGISSGLAALTAAFIPATLRGENQAIVLATGHSADAAEVLPGDVDWATLARLGQPMVLYMAVSHMAAITAALTGAGMAPEMPAAAIVWATTPKQRVLVTTLGGLADLVEREKLRSPAIVVIGTIVQTRARLFSLLPQLEECCGWAGAQ
ncbi:MAG: uroporphyrinogen-III C-methyltransferase [Acetobacteraceae bacterium]|nr:uroporphyrinogen-III C-methyltransferase [Acetobacteraceae bacterium]